MKQRPPRMPQLLLAELEGCDWSIERGTRHWLLRVGNVLVGVMPAHASTADIKNTLSIRAAIRRLKRRSA